MTTTDELTGAMTDAMENLAAAYAGATAALRVMDAALQRISQWPDPAQRAGDVAHVRNVAAKARREAVEAMSAAVEAPADAA